ncbi:MAG: dephospho-CoA kinase [Spirochaetales bacterium]|nr:dephospho-CoA kinase [Spirochaetales bacterium]
MPRAPLLGLTGGWAAGKNAAAALLEERGWRSVDVDRLGHAALVSKAAEVAALLGPGVLDAAGRPVRKAIGALVFADPALLARYEEIVHPAMNALVDAEVARAERDGVPLCLNAAVLYRMPHAARCDAIIEVRAPFFVRLRRGMRRDGLSLGAALARVRSQGPLLALGRLFAAKRHILRNSGDLATLGRALDALLSRLDLRNPPTEPGARTRDRKADGPRTMP